MRNRLLFAAAAFFASVAVFAQEPSVKWKVASEEVSEGTYQLTFTGKIEDGKHIYGINPGIGNPVEVEYTSPVTAGPLQEVTKPTEYKDDLVFFGKAVFSQEVTVESGNTVEGSITWQACTEDMCGFPEEYAFSVTVGPAVSHQTAIGDPEDAKDRGGLWALIIEAILWGFAMLLTPCVFPMIPMTVSFFLKGSENAHQGRFKAFMYGLFIVLLYTVPISVIIGLTRLLGGETVTADIFNWLATHWLPNLIFFLVFMVFAASFFGAFEIVLPSSWQNKSDANSSKKGLAGVFFMALTLVLVSFSCTGPNRGLRPDQVHPGRVLDADGHDAGLLGGLRPPLHHLRPVPAAAEEDEERLLAELREGRDGLRGSRLRLQVPVRRGPDLPLGPAGPGSVPGHLDRRLRPAGLLPAREDPVHA